MSWVRVQVSQGEFHVSLKLSLKAFLTAMELVAMSLEQLLYVTLPEAVFLSRVYPTLIS